MLGRFRSLTVLFGLLLAGQAQAHRLNAEASLLPNQRIQIDSWFSTGEPARDAKVEVFQADRLVAEGRMNDEGVFVFFYKTPEELKVVISAGPGHRKELTIAAGDLPTGGQLSAPTQSTPRAPVPLANRDSGVAIKDVVVGITFLLASAAFWLSLRNAQKLRRIKLE